MASAGLPTGDADSPPAAPRDHEYVVVARRYRPQTFSELVGQEHVARALSAAISTNRVGHAYLFTGARGVGKTSAARILAKCLNCAQGASPVPCDQCDSCLSIATGNDVDVLEIDGASNRGIEEMRELRHNVAIRPSRSRFKIYIIDEVHMLTREAFNALLKTLEEPPEHVKFIFCTTEAEKIPVTILSRCQRFDFAGIQPTSIIDRLQQIVAAEQVEADPAALAILSRRANGSMRDSQSLLEQLLSLGAARITVDDVNNLLGTASDERLTKLAGYLIARDAAAALAELDAAVEDGVDTGQLLDQLLLYCRDLMVSAVGGATELYAHANVGALQDQAKAAGLHTILAMMQVLDHTIARLRYSTQGRVLAELALVRICQLADLEELPTLIEALREGALANISHATAAPTTPPARLAAQPASPTAARPAASALPPAVAQPAAAPTSPTAPAELTSAPKKNGEADVAESSPSAVVSAPLDPAELPGIWAQAVAQFEGFLATFAAQAERVAISGPNLLVVTFAKKYNSSKSFCEQPEQTQRLERALAEVTGRPLRLNFVLSNETDPPSPTSTTRVPPARERIREVAKHPMVSRAMELFAAHPTKFDDTAP